LGPDGTEITIINMQAIADLVIVTRFNIQPASKNFLEHRKLNKIMWKAQKDIVASDYLEPF